MRVAVVVNASSGSASGDGALVADLAESLRRSGLDASVVGEAEGDLPARLRKALAGKPELLVVGGGDGTISCAAHLVAGTEVALGIVPLGTMNKLAKDLGLPLEPAEAVAVLSRGTPRRIDVGEVNGRTFLRSSMLGFPSRIAARRESVRGSVTTGDRWRLAVAFLRQLTRYPALPLVLRLRGERRHLRTRLLAVANNPYAEGFGQVLAKGGLDRGELVVYLAPRLGLWLFLRFAAAMLLGRWRGMEGLESRSVRSLVVHSRRRQLRVMNDGEPQLMTTPLRYRIRPAALTVMVPREGPIPADEAAADEALVQEAVP